MPSLPQGQSLCSLLLLTHSPASFRKLKFVVSIGSSSSVPLSSDMTVHGTRQQSILQKSRHNGTSLLQTPHYTCTL